MADLILQNGTIYDGSGSPPYQGDVAISGDQIAALGAPGTLDGTTKIDVSGLAVAPGFINMLSWSVESLIQDGCSQSEIRQGVTLEVMGEGTSMGPLSEEMRESRKRSILGNEDIEYEIEWTTLGEYLEYLERRGVSTNVASFVGSSTLRIHEIGYDDRPPTEGELTRMCELVRQAMREGAVGMSAALIYPPASYASTEELIALAKAVAEFDGMYISHLRSEGPFFVEAADELIRIAREAKLSAELYHLKAAGRVNWGKMAEVIQHVEAARAEGLHITADMYMYPAGGTGLNACIPPWAHDGGDEAMLARLRDPETRARIINDIKTPTDSWENMYLQVDSPDGILLAGFKSDTLKALTGKTLAAVAAERGRSPEDTLCDLLLEDGGRIFTMYFVMSEDNIRKQVQVPWVSFCSDAESMAPEDPFIKRHPHPRAYGNFARVLGLYVRDLKLITLEEAVRRLSWLPASNLKLKRRGALRPTYFADVVVFDPATIQDHATFENPHQYATGMQHVFVNGQQVLKNGEHTGAKPGRVVRGPGWTGHNNGDQV